MDIFDEIELCAVKAEELVTAIRKVHSFAIPTVPTSVSASVNGTTVSLTFGQAVGYPRIDGYRVYEGITQLASVSVSASPVVVSGIANGSHIYAISAVDGRGTEGSKASANSVLVSVGAPQVDAPTLFSASKISTTRVDLSWAAGPGGTAPTDYDGDYSTDGGSVWTALTIGLQTSFSHTGLSALTYTYRLKAKAGGQESGYVYATANLEVPFGTGLDLTNTADWRIVSDVINGWDWSYPSSATPADLSGMFQFSNDENAWATDFPANFTGKKIFKINADWNDMEPNLTTPRTYNFTSTLNKLSSLPSGWDGVQLDVRGTVYATQAGVRVTAPTWLAGQGISTHHSTNNGGFDYYDVGHTNWYTPFRALVRKIAAYTMSWNSQTYAVPAHPRLTCQIVHGQSNSDGEEAGLGQSPVTTGHLETLTTWASCYASNSYKLAWCGEGSPQDVTSEAYARGLSSRGGFIENFLLSEYTPRVANNTTSAGLPIHYTLTDIGQRGERYLSAGSISKNNHIYLTVNDSFTPIANNRHFADQNEAYQTSHLSGGSNPKPWGVHPELWNMYIRIGAWRHLQMRRNIMGIEVPGSFKNNAPIYGREGYSNPEVLKWESLNLGKRTDGVGGATHVAKEAFCALVKTYTQAYNEITSTGGQILTIHNFERFMQQREVLGATTTTLTTAYGFNPTNNVNVTQNEIDQARRMVSATTGIGFKLDQAFIDGAAPVAIKVTYQDNNTQTWRIKYKNASNTTVHSTAIVNTNTGVAGSDGVTSKIKTATFFLTDFNTFVANASDFSIVGTDAAGVASGTTTPFMFVRVVKT